MRFGKFGRFVWCLVAIAATACAESPAAPGAGTFTLAPGQSAVSASGARATFVRVLSDSRCPINANCVHAGEAVAEFTLSSRGLDAQVELTVVDRARSRVEVRGSTLEFTALQPYPYAGVPIDSSAYRATIELR